MNRFTDDQVREVAYALLGTCESPDYIVARTLDDDTIEDFVGDMSMAQCHLFDSIAMACEGCGWWYDPDDIDAECYCTDCSERDDD